MKRTPLTRKTPMARGDSQLRRTQIRRTTKPSKRSADPVTDHVYDTVMRRDGACLLQGLGPCGGRQHWHHRVKVEHGGPSTVPNGVRLCTRHHSRVHNYTPETVGRGLLLPRGADPDVTPVTLRDGRSVVLTPDGGYLAS